jgi:hypothetical protein
MMNEMHILHFPLWTLCEAKFSVTEANHIINCWQIILLTVMLSVSLDIDVL